MTNPIPLSSNKNRLPWNYATYQIIAGLMFTSIILSQITLFILSLNPSLIISFFFTIPLGLIPTVMIINIINNLKKGFIPKIALLLVRQINTNTSPWKFHWLLIGTYFTYFLLPLWFIWVLPITTPLFYGLLWFFATLVMLGVFIIFKASLIPDLEPNPE